MSCDTEAALVWPRPKHPDEAVQYSVDFGPDLVRRWKAEHTHASAGVFVRPSRSRTTGYDYELTTAGRTGTKEPMWPTTVAATVSDGSAVWTCRAPSTDSLITTISGTPTWAVDGLTVADEDIEGTSAVATLSGGEDGENYSVTITATTTNGQTLTQTCVLKVRTPVFVCDE